jgi:hypothetical protein
MNWLKKLFGKEEVKPVENISTDIQEEPAVKVPYEEVADEVCASCNLGIFPSQKAVRKFGNVYHFKPCWVNLQKQAKAMARGNI